MKAIIAVPIIIAMVYRAWSHRSLTPAGIVAAIFTAIAHAVHPWSLPFVLVILFFLAGTRVTKVKHDVKAKLTMQANGSSGGEGARTHIQVLANSGVASVLILLHAYQLHKRQQSLFTDPSSVPNCYTWEEDLLVIGIVANYAAVTADTFSSELGILSKARPRLITSLDLRRVPPGTNGGVTVWGLVAGFLGSLIIATASAALIPFCPESSSVMGLHESWAINQRLRFACALTLWGTLGSVLDSFLGGWFQHSVVDTRTGRIVEGPGGLNVLVATPAAKDGAGKSHSGKQHDDHPGRRLESGSFGLLDNNQVNFSMALIMSLGAMALGSMLRV